MNIEKRKVAAHGLLAAALILIMIFLLPRAKALPHQSADLPWIQLARLTSSNGMDGDWLGFSVALDGHTAVAGAPYARPNDIASGAVYLFTRDRWWSDSPETARLTPSNGRPHDLFGHALAVSEDVVIVGAPGNDDHGFDAGLAYIFVKPAGGWTDMTETARLAPSDPLEGGLFGAAVAIDESTIVVGAPHLESINGGDPGAAYIFLEPSAGWANQTEAAKIMPSDGAPWDGFGFSTAISGGAIAVGAPFDDDNGSGSGSAYVYLRPEDGWATTTESAKLTPSGGAASDWFGRSIAISGDEIIAGAPQADLQNTNEGAAYLFVKPESGWSSMNETARLSASGAAEGDLLGWSVAVDGRFAIATAPSAAGESPAGRAYVFHQPVAGWTDMIETLQLLPEDPAPLARFGISVAGSGAVFILGADAKEVGDVRSGAAYLFAQTGTIAISKKTEPAGRAGFIFSHDIPDGSGDFLLAGGQAKTFHQIPSGSYTVVEADPLPAFDLTSLDCTGDKEGGLPSSGDIENRTATIHLDPGETISCHFENTQRGRILVSVVSVPANHRQPFDFILSGGPDKIAETFVLSAPDGAHDAGTLKPGFYGLSEILPAQWQLDSALCENNNTPAHLVLQAGQTVQCTFTNRLYRFEKYFPVLVHSP